MIAIMPMCDKRINLRSVIAIMPMCVIKEKAAINDPHHAHDLLSATPDRGVIFTNVYPDPSPRRTPSIEMHFL